MPIVVTSSNPQPPSTDSTSEDGLIRATVMPESAGVFLRADFSGLIGAVGYNFLSPFTLTFYRELPDGTVSVVRGAASVKQIGGIVHAYDDEVGFGQIVSYWAEAPLSDGSVYVSGRASVVTWEPAGGFTEPGVWIKNLENPDLSVPARCIDWSAGSWPSRNAASDVWGGEFPAVTTDVRKSYSTQMTLLTKDEDEYQGLLQAISSSVVYIVGLERHRRRTGYYLVGDVAPARVGAHVSSTYDAWVFPLTGMARPVTTTQALVVPRRSYADRRRAYSTYRAVQDSGRAYGAGTEPYAS